MYKKYIVIQHHIFPNYSCKFDVLSAWKFAGVKKRLCELGKTSAFRKINNWVQSICNHLHWVVNTTEPHSDLRREKWLSVVNHLQNIHVHPELSHFKKCEHGEIEDTYELEGQQIVVNYMNKGKLLYLWLITKLIKNVRFCSDLWDLNLHSHVFSSKIQEEQL